MDLIAFLRWILQYFVADNLILLFGQSFAFCNIYFFVA